MYEHACFIGRYPKCITRNCIPTLKTNRFKEPMKIVYKLIFHTRTKCTKSFKLLHTVKVVFFFFIVILIIVIKTVNVKTTEVLAKNFRHVFFSVYLFRSSDLTIHKNIPFNNITLYSWG